MKNKLLVLLLITAWTLGGATHLRAQDPNYSQFFSNPLYYNPAYTGISQGFKARFDYRKQWPNLLNDFKTYNFNADISIREFPGSGGLGVIFNKDKAGAGYLETATAGLLTAVRVRLSENVFTQLGIMSSFVQKQVDWERFIFTDQIDPRYGYIYETGFIPPGEGRVAYPDFSAGSLIRFVQTTHGNTNIIGTFGGAVHHVFKPNETFFEQSSPLPRKIIMHADLIFESEGYSRQLNYSRQKTTIYNTRKFNPGMYYIKQGEFQMYSFGMNAYYKTLYGGLWYRNHDFDFVNAESIVVMLGINTIFNDVSRLKIIYSYDIALDNALVKTGGAHEIAILIELDDFSLFSSGRKAWGAGVKTGRGSAVYEGLECSPF